MQNCEKSLNYKIKTGNTYSKNLNCEKIIQNCEKNAELLDKKSQLQFFVL